MISEKPRALLHLSEEFPRVIFVDNCATNNTAIEAIQTLLSSYATYLLAINEAI